jgi:exopolyphosphatase/guanosine-5'-triphosphate,3'-diphosphate pyrophosphatase
MIHHADLATLTRREIEIIANVCRYHRKAGPKRGDPNFRKLGADDQRLVAHLVGILRVADGLDYSQKQNVTDVIASVADSQTLLEITAADDPGKELKRAVFKSDVFESAFRTKVKCRLRSASRVPAKV